MRRLKSLRDYKQQIEQCIKCGACQTHCPVFRAHRREAAVARGKLAKKRTLDYEYKDEAA